MFREKFLTILIMWAFVLVTLGVAGCKKHEHTTEHPAEHQSKETPSEETPSEEHPTSEHPTGEHPK